MNKSIYFINTLLILFVARYEFKSDNDKTIIISSLALAVLLVLNLMFGLFAQLDNKPSYRHFYYSALGIFVSAIILSVAW